MATGPGGRAFGSPALLPASLSLRDWTPPGSRSPALLSMFIGAARP
jgi:hypothetical protein